MLGADNALDEEPVHTVQDDGTDVDEDVRCDSKTDIPRIVGPCYPQGHCNDSNLAETKNSAIEYELMPATLVALQNLDVDDTKHEV